MAYVLSLRLLVPSGVSIATWARYKRSILILILPSCSLIYRTKTNAIWRAVVIFALQGRPLPKVECVLTAPRTAAALHTDWDLRMVTEVEVAVDMLEGKGYVGASVEVVVVLLGVACWVWHTQQDDNHLY